MSGAEKRALFWAQLPRCKKPPAELVTPLTESWLAAAQTEHASIASFSHFSLGLLAVGAPATLVESCHRAALDEVEHARISFALASHFSGKALGPGPLPLPQVPPTIEPEILLEETIVDGCIGETLAAAEADHAAECCQDPVVTLALEGIALDEAAHAELAWQFVGWLLEKRPELRQLARQTFAQHLERSSARAEASVLGATLADFGRLSAEQKKRLRGDAISTLILPAVAAL